MMVNKALELCEQVGILIGSSQESGTLNNPFDYEFRKEQIGRMFGEEIQVGPLEDIFADSAINWGKFVMECAERSFGCHPDLFVSGKEERRLRWFNEDSAIAELYVPKSIDISAARMIQLLIDDDQQTWKAYMDSKLYDQYERLRAGALKSKDKLYTDSMKRIKMRLYVSLIFY